MPTEPKHICQRCRKVITGPCPRCTKATRQVSDDRRGSSSKRGYGGRWKRERAAFIASDPKNACCAMCLKDGKVRPVYAVDHIIPHRGDPRLMWDWKNYQSLCEHHHNVKSSGERRNFGAN